MEYGNPLGASLDRWTLHVPELKVLIIALHPSTGLFFGVVPTTIWLLKLTGSPAVSRAMRNITLRARLRVFPRPERSETAPLRMEGPDVSRLNFALTPTPEYAAWP